jgi:exonuclease III
VEYFHHCETADAVESEKRWPRVLRGIEEEIMMGSVIALQEVSALWATRFEKFFDVKNYHFVFRGYGGSHNGFMGTAIAFPKDKFELVEADFIKISDTKEGGYVDGSLWNMIITKPLNFISSLPSAAWSLITPDLPAASTDPPAASTDPSGFKFPRHDALGNADFWAKSKERLNLMTCLKLRFKEVEEYEADFVITTYHMPCSFQISQMMAIHAALAAQFTQRYSGSLPYILCGDFNITPGSTPYKIITQGAVNENEVSDYPTPCFPGDKWKPVLDGGGMKSAYNEVLGKEPKLTNYNWCGTTPVRFEGTLDYIFFGGGKNGKMKVKSVRSLEGDIEKTLKCESLPTVDLPSDHLLLAAEFVLD